MDSLFENDKKPAHKKTRARNEIWDAVLKVFNMTDLSKSSNTRIGKVVRDLKARHATPEQILARKKRYQEMWPKMACTPEAVEKFWDDLVTKDYKQDPALRQRREQYAKERERQADEWYRQRHEREASDG